MTPTADLPTELVNLLALHSSFLTALSLHYAHNGTASPVDLRDLTASITKAWGQRKVTIDDVRLCVGVLGAGPQADNNPFYLSDYTHNKICLELRDEHKMAGAGLMNEDALQHLFVQSLEHLWAAWSRAQGPVRPISARPIATPKRGRGRPKKADKAQQSIQLFVDDTTILKFIAELPHAEIKLCASAVAIAPVKEKGRKRLREFQDSQKQGRNVKKARESTGKENEPAITQQQQPAAQAKITEFASVRKSNLLDRILAKEALAASGPAAPSPAEQQRRAALQRSEEVLRILSLLTAGKGSRVSFSMAALVQSLQGSIRSPLSRDEVMKCVEVLAQEVAPGYVNVVKLGAISSVVVMPGMRPVDVKQRLVTLGA